MSNSPDPIRQIHDLADKLVTQEEIFLTTIGPPQVTHDEWVQAMRDIRALASAALDGKTFEE